MKFKKLTDGIYRSYKSVGSWGIGTTIHESKKGVVLTMDIICENTILPFVNKSFEEIPIAKLYAVKIIRQIINELGKWTEE